MTNRNITAGAGIAIGVIWIAASAASIMFALIFFVWSTFGVKVFELLGIFGIALFVLIAAPFIVAGIVTETIASPDSD